MEGSVFAYQRKFLRVVGLDRDEKLSRPGLFKLLQVFNASTVVFVIFGGCCYISKNPKDLMVSAEAFGPVAISIITLSKILSIIAFKQQIFEFMDAVDSLSTNLKPSDVGRIHRGNRFVKIICVACLSLSSVTCFFYWITPIIVNIKKLRKGQKMVYDLPFKSAYPFNIETHPLYELIFLTFCWSSFYMLLTTVSNSP
jgi:7tm Odorant receptor